MTVLVFVSGYLPGYKLGGPIQSVSSIVERLGSNHAFRVVTSDRDLGDTEPFPEIQSDCWQQVGQALVRYLSPSERSPALLAGILRDTAHDVLYLNSCFNRHYSIGPLLLRRLGLVPRRPVVLAPRGELCQGALAIKRSKKVAFLGLGRALGIWRDVVWQATSDEEAAGVRSAMGASARISQVPNLAIAPNVGAGLAPPKVPGHVRAAYLSRVTRKKNLAWGLTALAQCRGAIELDIYGLVDDPAYWAECQRIIDGLPSNVRVTYLGPLPHATVPSVLATYHALFLPTLSENFGHAIVEALAVGCLPLISDQTPWNDLQQHCAGWSFSLLDGHSAVEAIQKCIDLDQTRHAAWSRNARAYASRRCYDPGSVAKMEELLQGAVPAPIQ